MNTYIQEALIKLALDIPLEEGDVVLTGRYKNKREVVKSLGTDELGQPTYNGKKLLTLRIEKELPKSKWSSKTKELAKKAAVNTKERALHIKKILRSNHLKAELKKAKRTNTYYINTAKGKQLRVGDHKPNKSKMKRTTDTHKLTDQQILDKVKN